MKVPPENLLRLMSPADCAKYGNGGLTRDECAAAYEARSEKDLQQKLEQLLLRRGHLPRRQRMDRRSNMALGMPDIQFEIFGHSVHWEVKFGAGRTTAEQDKIIAGLQAEPNRAIVRVIRSYREGLDHLQELTRRFRPEAQQADILNDLKGAN